MQSCELPWLIIDARVLRRERERERENSRRAGLVWSSCSIRYRMEEMVMHFWNSFHSLASLERSEDERQRQKVAWGHSSRPMALANFSLAWDLSILCLGAGGTYHGCTLTCPDAPFSHKRGLQNAVYSAFCNKHNRKWKISPQLKAF